jgi:hypothetical protein
MGYKIDDEFIGFEFKDECIPGISFPSHMKAYIGKKGKIRKIYDDRVSVIFYDGVYWSYPFKQNTNNYEIY